MRSTHQRRRLQGAGLLLVSMILLLTLPTAATGHVVNGKTGLTLDDEPALFFNAGARVIISGKLRSGVASCRARRLVRLYRVTEESARLVASDRTDGRGEFRFVLRPETSKRLFVAFAGSVRASYGHHHRCAPSTSRTLRLRRA